MSALKSWLCLLGREFCACWVQGGQWLGKQKWMLLLITGGVAIMAWSMTVFVDFSWSRWLRLPEGHAGREWSEKIGHWGDFAQYNLLVVAVLLVVSAWKKSALLRRTAVATFLAAVLAGVVCNQFRFAVGRPRPQAERVDEAAGPTPSGSYHGFPSGHTSVAFGTSTPALVLCPPVGIVLTLVSCLVAWARMADGVHYPSDVLVGAWIGVAFGLACGFAMRRKKDE